jgi:hypothetical protein
VVFSLARILDCSRTWLNNRALRQSIPEELRNSENMTKVSDNASVLLLRVAKGSRRYLSIMKGLLTGARGWS